MFLPHFNKFYLGALALIVSNEKQIKTVVLNGLLSLNKQLREHVQLIYNHKIQAIQDLAVLIAEDSGLSPAEFSLYMMKFSNNKDILIPVKHLESRIGLILEFSTYFLQPREKICPFAPMLAKFSHILHGKDLNSV